MAVKISELPAVTTSVGLADQFEVNNGGTSRSCQPYQITTAGMSYTVAPSIGWWSPAAGTLRTPNTVTIDGALTVSGVGPNAIGGATDSNTQLSLTGTFAERYGLGLYMRTQPPANALGFLLYLSGTIDKASSGTHSDFAGVYLTPPTINTSAATLSNATTLKITGAPTVGTNQRALWVAGGTTAFDSLLDISASGAGQIAFPATQNASSGANTLDDYEEGTFTPAVGGSATYTTQLARYVKVGKLVWIAFDLKINAIGTGSTSAISGLPFTAGSTQSFPIHAGYFSGSATSVVFLAGLVNSGATTIQLYSLTAAATGVSVNAIFANAAEVIISAVYEASA